MFTIIIRTIIVYIFIFFSMRLSGKRQVGELQLSELITAFLISEVASAPLSDHDIPLLYAIVPIMILIILEITVSFITTKSTFVKRIFEPAPTVIIENGKLNIDELEKQRLTVDELISTLRLKDIPDVSKVKFCFLEHNGQLSAFTEEDGLTLPIIVDGKIHGEHLKLLSINDAKLNSMLKAKGKKTDKIFVGLSDGRELTVFAERKEK